MTDVIPSRWHPALAPMPRRRAHWTYANPAHDGGARRKDGRAMNATLENYPAAEMRASDADRDAVLSELSEQFSGPADGRGVRRTSGAGPGRPNLGRAAGSPAGSSHRPGRTRPSRSPAATSSAARPERPSGRPALLPVAALAGIGIAVAMSVGVFHDGWGFWWLLLPALVIARRVPGAQAHPCAPARRPDAGPSRIAGKTPHGLRGAAAPPSSPRPLPSRPAHLSRAMWQADAGRM